MDPEALLNAVEYGLRSTRHLLSAVWQIHTATSGHKRAVINETEPCAACIQLAGAVYQNDATIAEFLKARRVRAPELAVEPPEGEQGNG